jgi:hypothetical protein
VLARETGKGDDGGGFPVRFSRCFTSRARRNERSSAVLAHYIIAERLRALPVPLTALERAVRFLQAQMGTGKPQTPGRFIGVPTVRQSHARLSGRAQA